MSSISIAPYFGVSRVVITGQEISMNLHSATVEMRPDKRFIPICSSCGRKADHICSHHERSVRDLDMTSSRLSIRFSYRKIYCSHCDSVVVEDLGVAGPWQRVTPRLARYVHELCKIMTVSDVSDHTGLNWKTVKNIDKKFLERDYGETDYNGLRILAVDEIALRKGHKYMTVVLDYESGRVVWMGLDRRYKTLAGFFKEMSEEQRSTIKAVGMDMWDPYIKAVKEYLPEAKIVFDLFHMVSAYGRLIDKVRNSEKKKASKEDKSVYKGTKYLLLKNRVRKHCHKQHLKELLELNETISTVYILKEKLKNIWKYKYRACAKKCLEEWCSLARSVEDPELDKFANTLENQAYGIINHCDYPIHTSKLEGVNNKIKVIKRKAYGYHDSRYFMLKVKQAFDNRANSLFGR